MAPMSALDTAVKGGKVLSRLFRAWPDDPLLPLLRPHVATRPWGNEQARGDLLAVECVEDPFYFALFGSLVEQLRMQRPVRVERVVVRSINGAVGTGTLHRLARSGPVSRRVGRQWARVWGDLANGVGYSSAQALPAAVERQLQAEAQSILERHPGDAPFDGLCARGIVVGDLVIDTCLRFRPAAQFDRDDPFVQDVLLQALRDIELARRYFSKRRPRAYLTSYTTYTVHGIPARVALQCGIPVWSFGNLAEVGKRLAADDPFHTRDTRHYRVDFDAQPDAAACLEAADAQLSLRLGGGIDAATAYMRQSAYADTGTLALRLPPLQGAVVIFLHDFFDSPHIYPDLVFPDFWAWICCTIRCLQDAGIPFHLKPHPNQTGPSGGVLQQLQAAFPGLSLLPVAANNAALAAGGIACGVTVYGTVAHELAYLGVPSIACARHPHHSFDFCRTATTVVDYQALLRQSQRLLVDRAQMRREALAFYYMHNLHGAPEERALRQAFVRLWSACNVGPRDIAKVADAVQALRSEPGFPRLAQVLWQSPPLGLELASPSTPRLPGSAEAADSRVSDAAANVPATTSL